MLNKNEILSILSITFVLGIIISLIETWTKFAITFGIVLSVILINTFAKKITAYYYQIQIEIQNWEFKRFLYYNPWNRTMYGHKPHQKLKSKFPAGFFFPLIIKALSFGLINWMACLVFDVKGTIYRTARKHQLYQFSEVTEAEIAKIAFFGIIANLFFAFVGYLINAPLFTKLNLQFAFWSSLPLGTLDGTKMFFGNKTLFIASLILSSLALIMSLAIMI